MQIDEVQNKIEAHNFALSDHYGTESFLYVPDFPGGMSILAKHNENGVSIEVKDAGDVLSPILKKIKGKILVKIDCEGSEYEILNSLKKAELFPYIYSFVIETHLGREDEIKRMLKSEGYYFYANKEVNGLGKLFAIRCKS